MVELDAGHLGEAELDRSLHPAMAGENSPLLINQHRMGESETANAPRQLCDLAVRMSARIARPGFEVAGRQILNVGGHALLLCYASARPSKRGWTREHSLCARLSDTFKRNFFAACQIPCSPQKIPCSLQKNSLLVPKNSLLCSAAKIQLSHCIKTEMIQKIGSYQTKSSPFRQNRENEGCTLGPNGQGCSGKFAAIGRTPADFPLSRAARGRRGKFRGAATLPVTAFNECEY